MTIALPNKHVAVPSHATNLAVILTFLSNGFGRYPSFPADIFCPSIALSQSPHHPSKTYRHP